MTLAKVEFSTASESVTVNLRRRSRGMRGVGVGIWGRGEGVRWGAHFRAGGAWE